MGLPAPNPGKRATLDPVGFVFLFTVHFFDYGPTWKGLDVNFDEDSCRVEDRNVQQNLNMLIKLALNIIKQYKVDIKSKRAFSKIMLVCLLDCTSLLKVIDEN